MAAQGEPQGELRSFLEHPGWPRQMAVHPNYSPAGGPATVDTDGDGEMEIFAASTDGKLYGWRTDGTALAGFPVTVGSRVQSSPSIGDITGDGVPEIVVVELTHVLARRLDGGALWSVALSGSSNMSSAVLEDLDGDGTLEVIAGFGNFIHVFRGDGSYYPGFPAAIQSMYGACATPAVGDLDNDGVQEIVVEGWEYLNVLHEDGTVMAGWPQHLPLSYDGYSYASPALVDFDGNGDLEIAVGYHESGGGNWSGKVAVWHHDGTLAPGWPYVMQDFGSWCYSTPAVGDVDEDGAPEFAVTSHNGRIYLFNFDGTLVPGFPVNANWPNMECSCSIADIDDDGHLEILAGSNTTPGEFRAYERDGTMTPGFPVPTGGAMVVSGSCDADVDGDGQVNVCIHTSSGSVHLWDLPYTFHADRVAWGRPYHDDHHTGNVRTPNPASIFEPSIVAPSAILRGFPNPTRDRIVFSWQGGAAGGTMELLDPSGRRIAAFPLGGSREAAIDLRALRAPGGAPLPAGVYLARFRSDPGGTATAVRSFVFLR
ncbi:MAG: T9SS type A sorting domain-containing protein [Candidatus Eisenbacteria bacterium]